jgi:hypothetical protein
MIAALAATDGLCVQDSGEFTVFIDPLEPDTIPEWETNQCLVEAATEVVHHGTILEISNNATRVEHQIHDQKVYFSADRPAAVARMGGSSKGRIVPRQRLPPPFISPSPTRIPADPSTKKL